MPSLDDPARALRFGACRDGIICTPRSNHRSPASVITKHNVTVAGTGPQTLLFAHGFGCDQNMWRFVAPAFADRYRTVLFDHVGAGQSDPGAYDRVRYNTLHGYADDVLAICEELEITGGIFVGHSVSATIGLLAAIEQPHRFEKLALVGPSPCYIDDADYVGGFSRSDCPSAASSSHFSAASFTSRVPNKGSSFAFELKLCLAEAGDGALGRG